MQNLKLHFRKLQSRDKIKLNQPRFAAVPGQSHAGLHQMSPSGLQNGGCPCLCPSAASPLSPAQRVLHLTPPRRECSMSCLARTLTMCLVCT